jgi:hypothetical protein
MVFQMKRTRVLWIIFGILAVVGQLAGWFPHIFDLFFPLLTRALLFLGQGLVGVLIVMRDSRIPTIFLTLLGFVIGQWFIAPTLLVVTIWSIVGFAP